MAKTKEPVDRDSRGVGDTLAKAFHAIGIDPCDGCEKRRDVGNKLLPYFWKTGEKPSKPEVDST